MDTIFLVGVGLLAGWLLIPAPRVVTDFWKRMFSRPSGGDGYSDY